MSELYASFLDFVISSQQKLNLTIADYFDRLDAGETTVSLYIIGVAFLYGLIHALGPGHGKMVIASYFLVKESKTKEAFKAGFLTSVIHTVSALAITGILYIFFENMITKYFKDINANMYKISAVFIILIACYLLYEVLTHKDEEEHLETTNNKSLFTIALSIGIVPCPGVMSIVLFSMILGYINLGIASAIAMSIGMGLTISLAAILSSNVRSSKAKDYKSLMNIFTYAGIAVLFTMGVVLLV